VSSNDIATANAGDVVHACLETFNLDGVLRLQIDYPVMGWISKNLGLVERIEADAELLEKMESRKAVDTVETVMESDAEAIKMNFKKKLLEVEDSMEMLTGSELFTKEDRFFGHMQGASYAPFIARNHRRSLSSKPLKLLHFQQQLESTISAAVSSERYRLCITPMMRLYCRKLALVLILRNLATLKNNAGKYDQVSIMSILSELVSDGNTTVCERLADQITLLLRLVMFRGEPTSNYGV
jgi:hypothetical protein